MKHTPLSSVFKIKHPITPLQANVDRLVHKVLTTEFEGAGARRMFGVPVSAIVPQPIRSLDLDDPSRRHRFKPGHLNGKLSVLLVDFLDWSPICAIIINNPIESNVIRSVEGICANIDLPYTIVSQSDYEQKVRTLLENCFHNHKRRQKATSPAHEFERSLSETIRYWLHPGAEFFRPLYQVAMSEVIECFDSHSRKDIRDIYRTKRPNSKESYDELGREPFGHEKQQIILNDFCAQSSFDIVILFLDSRPHEESNWWPSLAIEIDGEHHSTPKQQFKDFMKDEISREAFLPLLRIRLLGVQKNRNLHEQSDAERGIRTPSKNRPEIDFIHFMIRRSGSTFHSQQCERQNRDRMIDIGERIRFLIDHGHSEQDALDISIQEDSDKNYESDLTNTWAIMEDKKERKERIENLRELYFLQYGKKPNLTINLDDDNCLSGNLDETELPPMSAFCSVVGKYQMRELQLEFGETWLLCQALKGGPTSIEKERSCPRKM